MKSFINDISMVRGRIFINPFLERGAQKVNSTMSMLVCVVEYMGKVFQIGHRNKAAIMCLKPPGN